MTCRDHDWESKNACIILTEQSLLVFPESEAREVGIDEGKMTLTRHECVPLSEDAVMAEGNVGGVHEILYQKIPAVR